MPKEDQKDEEVVHREGLLDQIPGKKLHAGFWAHCVHDKAVESQSQTDPDSAPAERFLNADCMILAVKDAQIQGQ